MLSFLFFLAITAGVNATRWFSGSAYENEHDINSHGSETNTHASNSNSTPANWRVCTENFQRGYSNESVPWGIAADVTIAPGKADRFKELLDESIVYFKNEEPGTLVFEYYEQVIDDVVHLALIEKYQNYAALEAHEASQVYSTFFQKTDEENLLVGAPDMVRGRLISGFTRLTCSDRPQ